MSPPDPTEPPTSVGPARRKRTDEIVDAIKRKLGVEATLERESGES